MAVTLPEPEDLDIFSHDATAIFDNEQKAQAIQQAGDLLYLATGITKQPSDERTARIVLSGLSDMAWKLLIDTENKSDSYSPYVSERIGSYSYNKAFTLIQQGKSTGAVWFDRAVRILNAIDNPEISVHSHNFFSAPEFGLPWGRDHSHDSGW